MDQLTVREQKNLELQNSQDLQEHIRKQLPIKKNNNVDVYFVRHAESCSNISTSVEGKITHPPLSYKGMQQAINLSINNKIIDMDFDKYYCSPSLRTIMTACLALRRKFRSSDKPLELHLCPYLIEHKNLAENLRENEDQQNSIVPKKQLQNMINYIKLWFEQQYFDNYIDYEFVHIMFNLVLLLKYNNKLLNYIEPIKNLLEESTESKEKINRTELLNQLIINLEEEIKTDKIINEQGIINNTNNDISNIYNNIMLLLNNPDSEDLLIYEISNSKNKINYKIIIEQLRSLLDSKYFLNKITIKYNYSDDVKHNPNIEEFVKNEIDPIITFGEKSNNKILCFTHGSLLKDYFKLEIKLKNTEILFYNPNNVTRKETKQIFNNNIIIDEKLVKDTCGGLENIINLRRLFGFSDSTKYKMFRVINKYFNYPNYIINIDENIEYNFKVRNDEEEINEYEVVGEYEKVDKKDGSGIILTGAGDNIYKHKYLKYKHKYLKYKQYLK